MPTNRVIACLSFAVLLGANQALFASPGTTRLKCASVPGIKTEAEVEFVSSQRSYLVSVTFIAKVPSSKDVDRVLRNCVAAAVKRDGTKEILGTPWFRKHVSDNPDDDGLLQPYGDLKYLVYDAASKKIVIRELKPK